MLEDLVHQLVEELELEPATKEKKTTYLSLNKDVKITIKELESGLYFTSPIGPCPEEKREELFIHIMKANFLGMGTGGAAIGFDNEEKFLTLSSALPYDMNFKSFKESVEDFVNYVYFWREDLVRHKQAAQKDIFR